MLYEVITIVSLLPLGAGFVCAFVELDHLKEINREAGVTGGDRIVADVAGFRITSYNVCYTKLLRA